MKRERARMRRTWITALAAALLSAPYIAPAVARATSAPVQMPMAAASAAPVEQASPAEIAFVSRVAKRLLAEFPTAAEAERAGYRQTTGVGSDGTSIYFNDDFVRLDELHPNFLWYDRRGRLVGLDYEYPQSEHPQAPTVLFPVQASRWTVVHEHIHYAYRLGTGVIAMHGARATPRLRSPHIGAQALRAEHLLPAGATLLWAYYHPACWDLGFWLVPNPNGPFADLNPNVK
ncbi:MAG: hypothetical protein KGM44_06010 [bacterium]|nr:hypothetical protein [bacterium]